MGQFDEIRQRLEKHKSELRHRVEKIKRDVRHLDIPLEADFAEQAVQRGNDDVLTGISESAKAEIVQIDKALARIDDGQYGICASCGEPIEPKRLEALPYSDLCVSCANSRSGPGNP